MLTWFEALTMHLIIVLKALKSFYSKPVHYLAIGEFVKTSVLQSIFSEIECDE